MIFYASTTYVYTHQKIQSYCIYVVYTYIYIYAYMYCTNLQYNTNQYSTSSRDATSFNDIDATRKLDKKAIRTLLRTVERLNEDYFQVSFILFQEIEPLLLVEVLRCISVSCSQLQVFPLLQGFDKIVLCTLPLLSFLLFLALFRL